jgi:hypothetical protein
MQPRLASNSPSFPLSLLSTGIADVHPWTQLIINHLKEIFMPGAGG